VQDWRNDDTQTLPGWFGKLPGLGDFAHRRLPAPFRQGWDSWLHDGLAGLRARHADDWTMHYLESPLWCFALGPDTVDATAWIGVLMPSVDGVGRYFPLTLTRPFDAGMDSAAWWTCAARIVLDALDDDLDAERFEALLAQCFNKMGASGEDAPPPAGQSSWRAELKDGTLLRLAHAGLPRGARFDALFGFAQDAQPLELLP
jgi:type VI secretion system protein ImpM